jgi:hypothetical protein
LIHTVGRPACFAGDVIVKQALRDVQELAVADAEPPGLFGQSCEVAR